MLVSREERQQHARISRAAGFNGKTFANLYFNERSPSWASLKQHLDVCLNVLHGIGGKQKQKQAGDRSSVAVCQMMVHHTYSR